MPIFEFRCNTCRDSFSTLVGVVARNCEAACPACGGRDLTRLISQFCSMHARESVEQLADEAYCGGISSMERLIGGVKEELGDDVGQDLEQLIGEC